MLVRRHGSISCGIAALALFVFLAEVFWLDKTVRAEELSSDSTVALTFSNGNVFHVPEVNVKEDQDDQSPFKLVLHFDPLAVGEVCDPRLRSNCEEVDLEFGLGYTTIGRRIAWLCALEHLPYAPFAYKWSAGKLETRPIDFSGIERELAQCNEAFEKGFDANLLVDCPHAKERLCPHCKCGVIFLLLENHYLRTSMAYDDLWKLIYYADTMQARFRSWSEKDKL